VGVSKTRALLCELLAMRLLKEFTTRQLIDALSYDYDPLQGLETPVGGTNWPRQRPQHARISALEIAIRAEAKKFLAHPLVVQQLEAIWAGTIVFHAVADSLHRKPDSSHSRNNPNSDDLSPGRGPSRRAPAPKQSNVNLPASALMRRTVTLYDPHEASLFKLSRLRVPRYRNLFSTLSFGMMLGLFLAVLAEKSDDITVLEVIFWFWSAGYMLDEIVGFSEQGFGLYSKHTRKPHNWIQLTLIVMSVSLQSSAHKTSPGPSGRIVSFCSTNRTRADKFNRSGILSTLAFCSCSWHTTSCACTAFSCLTLVVIM